MIFTAFHRGLRPPINILFYPGLKVDQRGHGERLCKKDCQASNLNSEDAMDRGRWKKLIKIG